MRVSATAKYIRRLDPQGPARHERPSSAAASRRPPRCCGSCPRPPPATSPSVLKSADGQRREQPQPVRRRPVRGRRAAPTRARTHQALAAAGPGPGVPHPQADDAHHRRRRETGRPEHGSQGPSRTASGWASRAPGTPSGTPTRTTPTLLKEDIADPRSWSSQRLANASVSQVEIERGINHVTVTIHTAKPGIVIGKGGANVEIAAPADRRAHAAARSSSRSRRSASRSSTRYLVAANIAQQLARRIAFRKAMKQAIQRTMKAGAKGVKIAVAGRLGGSEMARREWDTRRAHPARHAARRHQLRPGPRPHDLRPHRRQGLDLPRRRRCPSGTRRDAAAATAAGRGRGPEPC